MAQVSRNPFARTELHRESIPATRLTTKGCAWCDNLNSRGGLFAYRNESDDGRNHPISRLFCSVSCMRNFHGA